IKVFQDRCCGLAGTFGLKKKYFDLSLEIGRPLLEEIRQSEVDIVATSCPACAIQISQGTGIKTIHPIILLKEAYRQAKVS
ncbi:MAG: heterodisulfide reductase-related iron-sulfur binding cluster, partial [bacterium]